MNNTQKQTTTKWLGLGSVLLALILPAAGLAQTSVLPLSADEQTWLTFMREEEKVARDAYLTFYELWGFRSFQSIAKSEQTHMSALKTLLVRYGVEDPVTDDTVGRFANPELQALFDALVAQGSVSLADALAVGILIEEADIADLNAAIAVTTHRDALKVYQNLLRGSNSHLKAFTKSLPRASQATPAACTGTGTCQVTGTGTNTCAGTGTCAVPGTCTGTGGTRTRSSK